MERTEQILPGINKLQLLGAVLGLGGLAAFVTGLSSKAAENPWQSYLFGFLVWMLLTIGFLGLTLLIHMTRGKWGYSFIRFIEAGSRMIVPMSILFIPILLFLPDIFPWAQPETVEQSKLLQHKAKVLNPEFFTVRAVFYFAVWAVLAYFLSKWSRDEDRTGDMNNVIKRGNLAAPGAVLFVVTVNFAVTDWIMSLEEHWFSTIFGLLCIVGGILMALAVAAAYVTSVWNREPFSKVVTPQTFHDIGNLLFTVVVFWAYLAFSQFLIIWSANLPEEITYYADRQEGGWTIFGSAVVFLHFMLPFLLLLSKRLKRNPSLLRSVAIWIVVLRLGEIFWAVLPSFHRTGVQIHWMDFAAIVGVGGVWLVVFAQILKGTVLLPRFLNQPKEAAEHA